MKSTTAWAATLLLGAWLAAAGGGDSPLSAGAPAPTTQEQQRLAGASPEQRELELYRSWLALQPEPLRQDEAAAKQAYGAALAAAGRPRQQVAAVLALLNAGAGWSDVDHWNLVLTSGQPTFNTAPNAFLVEMVEGRTPGAALDIGMGQGRNAIYLAQHGWRVTGFDLAEHAVAVAQEAARSAGVALDAVVDDDDHLDWGSNRWDLIVMTYVRVRGHEERVYDALKPGGIVVVEGFHRDAARTQAIGSNVVFDTNELLLRFSKLRVRRYEDTLGSADFGGVGTPLVRLCAEKP